MSKSIRSYPKEQRPEVVRRRLAQDTHGLGYCAAVDYMARKKELDAQNKPKSSA